MKTCPKCDRDLPLNEFYVRTRGRADEPTSYCKRCLNQNSMERSRKLKQQAIAYKGGECEHCGYNKYEGALEFHHTDPSEKDFKVSTTRYAFSKIKKELDKCILLCANCHREEHGRLNGLL